MALKTFKPVTPPLRYASVADFSVLTPKEKLPKRPKRLFAHVPRKSGRNNQGRETSFQRGGGHKKRYRVIDFKRDKTGVPAQVASIEYDPNRTAYIALLNYLDGEKRYILAPYHLKTGDRVVASEEAEIQPGNHMTLGGMPLGTVVHNVELEPGRGGKIARSAGSYATLVAKDGRYCHLKMPSGEIRLVHEGCQASIGQLSNPEHENVVLGKAGRSRYRNRRPHVRGVAMNPIDHPMGGGEGKASGGHPRSPWGQSAKGLRTRRNKRTSRYIVRRRRKK